jgi:hypothetical protein
MSYARTWVGLPVFLLLAIIFTPVCFADNPLDILNAHQPTRDGAPAETQAAAPTVASPTAAPAAGANIMDALLAKLKAVVQKLRTMVEKLAKLIKDRLTAAPPATAARPPAAANVPTAPAPAAGAKGGKALLGWLQQAGLSGEKLRMAWSISMAESGGNPRAFNGNARTGDKSYGLFQINMLGSLGPARMREFGLQREDQLFDPMTNIRAMLKVSSNGTNWRPWSVYKSGSYRRFYNQFPPK